MDAVVCYFGHFLAVAKYDFMFCCGHRVFPLIILGEGAFIFWCKLALKLEWSDADSELGVRFHNKYAPAIAKNGYDGT